MKTKALMLHLFPLIIWLAEITVYNTSPNSKNMYVGGQVFAIRIL